MTSRHLQPHSTPRPQAALCCTLSITTWCCSVVHVRLQLDKKAPAAPQHAAATGSLVLHPVHGHLVLLRQPVQQHEADLQA